MFATAHGSVRRNAMDAFTNVPTAGKLAIRFEEGDDDRLIAVRLCDEADDVFLAARSGKAIRFPVDDVREFVSRTSTGVRGMTLGKGDEVVSMSILKAFPATPQEREDYLKAAAWKQNPGEPVLSELRVRQFAEAEQFILTVTANGYGKISSAFEYRLTGRGGQGITNISNIERNGPVVASFPAPIGGQIMLVTDQAKLIRIPVELRDPNAEADDDGLRIIGRSSAGIRLFKVADNEHVVSAALIPAEDDDGEAGDAAPEGADSEG
jgi:DNA gyrase subunit A